MTERLTITVEPTLAQGEHPPAADALRQLLDLISMLESASEPDIQLEWRLVAISHNSPLTATVQAFGDYETGLDVDIVARRAIARTTEALTATLSTGERPPWFSGERLEGMLSRHLSVIGKTHIIANNNDPAIVIAERNARIAIEKIRGLEIAAKQREDDFSGTELGSVEGYISMARLHRGRPSVIVADRISGRNITCIISDDLAAQVGGVHNLQDIWSHKRIIVGGLLKRDRAGDVVLVVAERLESVISEPLHLPDVQDRSFTGGMASSEYLAKIRGLYLG